MALRLPQKRPIAHAIYPNACGRPARLTDTVTPDAAFLSHLRREQLEAVALESGATHRLGKLKDLAKKDDLVQALARHFARTIDASAEADESDRKGRAWLPGLMAFPAEETASMVRGE